MTLRLKAALVNPRTVQVACQQDSASERTITAWSLLRRLTRRCPDRPLAAAE